MPDEKELGLKPGGEKTPAENSQSDKKEPESLEDLDKEIDKVLTLPKDDIDLDAEGQDETVVLSKKKLEKFKNAHNNYRNGLLSIKEKIKLRKGVESPKEQNQQPQGEAAIQKDRDKQAIEVACEDTEVNENWGEIMKHYKADGRNTVAQKIKGIQEAKAEWKKTQSDPKEGKENKDAKADLGSDKAKPGGESGKMGEKTERKHVLAQKSKIQNWYPKKNKE
jgi:hypothetical protein